MSRHAGMVTIWIDGIAASAASYIAMAGDEIVMPENAFLMIHDPSGMVIGTAADMRDMAGTLDKIAAGMLRGYAARSGKPEDEIAALMAAETWLTAAEALEAGLATRMAEPVRIAASFDIARFRNAPRELVEAVVEIDDDTDELRDGDGQPPETAPAYDADPFATGADPETPSTGVADDNTQVSPRDPDSTVAAANTAPDATAIRAEALGFWLKAAFGVPTTTGAAAPYSHEFQSGAWTLPSMSIETGMPEVPRYAMYSGCVLDQLTWQMQRSGLLTATARLVAQGKTVGTTTSAFGAPASPPAALELKRFGHFNGAITRNGTALGNVVSAEITYANNLDRIETIRSDGRIDGADPSIAALTGRIEVRFADQTLV